MCGNKFGTRLIAVTFIESWLSVHSCNSHVNIFLQKSHIIVGSLDVRISSKIVCTILFYKTLQIRASVNLKIYRLYSCYPCILPDYYNYAIQFYRMIVHWSFVVILRGFVNSSVDSRRFWQFYSFLQVFILSFFSLSRRQPGGSVSFVNHLKSLFI